jgi:hypothetical protein
MRRQLAKVQRPREFGSKRAVTLIAAKRNARRALVAASCSELIEDLDSERTVGRVLPNAPGVAKDEVVDGRGLATRRVHIDADPQTSSLAITQHVHGPICVPNYLGRAWT